MKFSHIFFVEAFEALILIIIKSQHGPELKYYGEVFVSLCCYFDFLEAGRSTSRLKILYFAFKRVR